MSLARIPRRRNLPAPTALSPALRRRIENAIEALILLLDAADPDPDLESDEDLEDDHDQDVSEERQHA